MNSKEALLGLMTACNVGLLVSRPEDVCRICGSSEGLPDTVATWAKAGPSWPNDIEVGLNEWPSGKSGQWHGPAVSDEFEALFDAIDPLAALEILAS